jgi:peptidoglycan/xylan/chitin deacetylase (PgdA/CDA1 family)
MNCHRTRRQFLGTAALGAAGVLGGAALPGAGSKPAAQIAITLDLEMAANFPKWEDTHWNFEKGNLNAETKRYAVEAARRVKAHGGVAHFFLVARALEQEDVGWLKEIIRDGHAVGNHTYDHVNVKALKPADIQFRFQREPGLIAGMSPAEVIRRNIRQAGEAMQKRLGLAPVGFRTPGGFANGLADRPDLQTMLLELGYQWVSSKYPAHPNGKPGEAPDAAVFEGIVRAQAAAQPFRYPSGLIEVPMSPISDIGAFRNGRWQLEHFLQALRLGVEWAIAERAVFDLLVHPACLSVVDPEFRAIELVCDLTGKAGERAALVQLETVASRVV